MSVPPPKNQLIRIDNESLNAWRQDDLTSAVAILSRKVQDGDHHRLANLALVRARLQQWDLAEQDARASIQAQPTVLAHIALSVALGGKGDLTSAKQEFNRVFLRSEPRSDFLLLLIKSIIVFVAGDRNEAVRRVTDLVKACAEADDALCRAVQAQMRLLVGQTALNEQDYEKALKSFTSAEASTPFPELPELETISLMFGWDFNSLLLVIRQQMCEAQYAASHMSEAVESLRAMLNEFGAEIKASVQLSDWVESFTSGCIKALESAGDTAAAAGNHDEAIVHYSMALSLDPPSRADLVSKRIKVRLAVGGWDDAMKDLDEAGVSRFIMYRQIGEALLEAGRVKEAAEMLYRLRSDLGEDGTGNGDHDDWVTDFSQQCADMLERLGDGAMDGQRHDEAIIQYSSALSLSPSSTGLFIKRSKAYGAKGLWDDSLNDTDQAIKLDPSSPQGYEMRHSVLHALQRYDEAVDTFNHMLSIIERSLDPETRQLRSKYVSPAQSEMAIISVIREVSKICPFVLIDVKTGFLCNERERTDTFKSEPQFMELVSSMTLELDNGYILRVVGKYFQYVTFSHVWEGKEPSFQDVQWVKSVWNLDPSPLNNKLRKFCEVVREDGYLWAWSDTCCIEKTISTVLNQSLRMMYRWYEASAATFVFLADVDSLLAIGSLGDTIWMTRAWTLLELLAPKVIRFYDRNWKPYLGDTHANHKESPEIMLELANAISIPRETIKAFNPDDLTVREKLRLASTRNATVEEDIAYSLIGIFQSNIRPHYGEGDAALGHLLEEIIVRSGEVTVLAWTGKSSFYNSCLPVTLTVYNRTPPASPTIEDAEMHQRVAALKILVSHADAMRIRNQITRLPAARFVHRRLLLPCIIFAVKRLGLQSFGSGNENHYRARVPGIGHVEFHTSDSLSLTEPRRLVFVHPWIRDLLDPVDEFAWGSASDSDESEPESKAKAKSSSDLAKFKSDSEAEPDLEGSLPTSRLHTVPAAKMDPYTRALRLLVRLQQPFHALLLQQQSHGEFKRVAAEHEIVIPRLDPQINFAEDIRIEALEIS